MTVNNNDIRFSVIIPVYNREHLIGETIKSVLAQSFSGYELIVINDGSHDNTQKILEGFGGLIKTVVQSNQGPEAARLNGVSAAKGEYLVFLDSDDLLTPHALETYEAVINKFGSPPLVIGSMVVADSGDINTMLQNKSKHPGTAMVYCFKDYLSKNVKTGMSNSLIIVKKVLYKKVDQLFEFKKSYPFDDLHFLLKCGIYGPCLVIVRPYTVIYRIHHGNILNNYEFMVHGAIELVKDEWAGKFPGGAKRRYDRWARIGGITFGWVRRLLMKRHVIAALKVLVFTFPMIVVAAIGRIRRKCWACSPSVVDI